MLLYVMICIALAMSGVAGMQFFYLAYLERLGKQYKRRIYELERQNGLLYHRWQETEQQNAAYQTLEAAELIEENEDEVWAEIIEE